MGTGNRHRLLAIRQMPGLAAAKGCLAPGCLVLALLLGGETAPVLSSPAPVFSKAFLPADRNPLRIVVQDTGSALLPSLVLPPDATAGPPMFTALMRQGDSAMVRGNIVQARSFYERAAAVHQASPAALLAVGKTFDPHILSSLGIDGRFADPAAARDWYGRARALGDPSAAELLARLP